MAKRIKVTYYDNFNYDLDLYKEYYQECNNLTDEEMVEVSDDEIYEFLNDQLSMEWDDFCENLKYSKYANSPCVIIGTLGLWHSRPTFEPGPCDGIETAINKCISNMDYIIIKQINGHLEVDGIHHDGHNHFEIYLLNDRGINAKNRIESGYGSANLGNKCYHKALKDYLF